jgi:hypothetical protein
MKPSFYSKIASEDDGIGWHQDGCDFSFEPSIYAKDINELNPKMSKPYMMMSFSYVFKRAEDETICAYTLPYTYSAMQAHIKHLKMLATDCRKIFIC